MCDRFSSLAEPTSVELHVDGVTDICTKEEDINFVFNGFSVSGAVRILKDLTPHSGKCFFCIEYPESLFADTGGSMNELKS